MTSQGNAFRHSHVVMCKLAAVRLTNCARSVERYVFAREPGAAFDSAAKNWRKY